MQRPSVVDRPVRFRAAAGVALTALSLLAAGCSAEPPEARVAFALEAPSAAARTTSAPLGAGSVVVREPSRERFESTTEGACPPDMVTIEGRYCIDRYEAGVVEVMDDGSEQAFSPFGSVTGRRVRAVSRRGVFPQGYISAHEAQRACAGSGKRLCKPQEWTKACRGPEKKQWGYGDRRAPGKCNDRGRNPVVAKFGFRFNWNTMHDPALNQMGQTLAKTGQNAECTNGYGVFDMVGNLHEWVADPEGTFQGGYYADVSSWGHGEGCGYVTTAHEARYHDYSTGFRCCADPNLGGEY